MKYWLFLLLSLIALNAFGAGDVNERSKEMQLDRAVFTGDVKALKKLLEDGGNPNWLGLEGNRSSQLVTAVNGLGEIPNKVEVVQLLLEYGADPNLINGKHNTPPLVINSIDRSPDISNIKIAKLLIKYGADINAKDKRGSTAFTLAIGFKQKKLSEFLFSQGAGVSPENVCSVYHEEWEQLFFDILEKTPPPYGCDLLIMSIRDEKPNVLEKVLALGVNPNRFHAKTRTYTEVPVIYTARFGHLEALKLLHQYGAKLNVVDVQGRTIRTAAEKGEHTEIIKWLDGSGH